MNIAQEEWGETDRTIGPKTAATLRAEEISSPRANALEFKSPLPKKVLRQLEKWGKISELSSDMRILERSPELCNAFNVSEASYTMLMNSAMQGCSQIMWSIAYNTALGIIFSVFPLMKNSQRRTLDWKLHTFYRFLSVFFCTDSLISLLLLICYWNHSLGRQVIPPDFSLGMWLSLVSIEWMATALTDNDNGLQIFARFFFLYLHKNWKVFSKTTWVNSQL